MIKESYLRVILIVVTLFTLSRCNSNTETKYQNNEEMVEDKHSYAKPSESKITHLNWKANIDFDKQIITAVASYDLLHSLEVNEVILDTKDLSITKVTNGSGEDLPFRLKDEDPILGEALIIEIKNDVKSIQIHYQTSPRAEALQWLTPEQTAGKKKPFLFTQSQAILARSWIPIQDSPGIRFTYEAEVTVPKDLLALMSASNPVEKNELGVYTFEMKQPIPAYLMALTAGDVYFHSLSSRTGLYAEEGMIEKSAYEFEDLEKMVVEAEKLYGDYRWDRYDLIVLPPSFPFGGMENPRLTFVTPTIIAGDKSLTSLVAHELAHSWSGNLVTNATWDDFWLNEGFTVYFEYRIMEALYGREYSEMLALLSLQGLKSEIKDMMNEQEADTHLKLSLQGRNPDDGLTAIAYDKGYFFLRLLEETVGREKWDGFLKQYFNNYAFQVMTTERFLEILKNDLLLETGSEDTEKLISDWVYGSGLPKNCPIPKSSKFKIVEKALEHWNSNFNKNALVDEFNSNEWSTHEWLHFIQNLDPAMGMGAMEKLDIAFNFTDSGNSEVFAAWAIFIISNQYEPGYANLENFLIQTGRRKFLTPLYGEMIKTEDGKAMALDIYQKARVNYHSVAFNTLDELLK